MAWLADPDEGWAANDRVGTGLHGGRGQRAHAVLQRDGSANLVGPLAFRPEYAAPARLGL